MAIRGRILLVVLLSTVILVPPVLSAPPPDAGSLLREQQKTPAPLPDTFPPPKHTGPPPPAFRDTTVQVTVKGFRFSGIDDLVEEDELRELLRDAVGKKLDFVDLQKLAGRVTAYLQDRGFFLARAYLPEQDITSGIIEIAITAGRIEGDVEIRIKPPKRINENILKNIFENGIGSRQALRNNRLERALLLMNDLPGISARATLERGATPGGTRVFIDGEEGPLFSGSLSADNFGNRYTGAARGSTGFTLNDPFGIGDQFSLTAVGSEDLFQGLASYRTLLHPSGLKGGINYTGLYYRLGKELEDLDAHGYANTLGASLSYPLMRSRALSFWSSLSYDFRMLDDFALDTKTRERELHVGTIDLTANGYDGFAGGGLTNLRLAFVGGDLHLGDEQDAEADAATAKTEGGYGKFSYSASRLQRLIGNFSLFAFVDGQVSGSNLDSSEKFSLGGPYGIRSYPVGEGVGDSGHSITAELRYDVPWKSKWGTLQIVTFIDNGTITLHESTWLNSVNTATGDNSYWLSGGGLGINLNKSDSYALRLSCARTIGDNPGRSVSGYDADNKNEDYRLWLQATFWL